MVNNYFFHKIILIFSLVFLSPLQAVTAQTDKVLTFGVYEYLRSHELYRKFGPLRDYIQKELNAQGWNVTIQAKVYPSYEAAIDALVNRQIDFTRFGPVSYVISKDKNPGIQLLAMEDNFGKKYFEGVIFVKHDSPIQTLADVKGKKIAFGSQHSTTGRYLPQMVLKKAGITGADLAGYDYLGRHDAVALSVYNGDHHVGAVNENTFKKYKDLFGLRSISTFPSVTKPWIAREGMDVNLFKALQKVLLELKDKKLLKIIKRSGLIIAEDSQYNQIREGMSAGSYFPSKSVKRAENLEAE